MSSLSGWLARCRFNVFPIEIESDQHRVDKKGEAGEKEDDNVLRLSALSLNELVINFMLTLTNIFCSKVTNAVVVGALCVPHGSPTVRVLLDPRAMQHVTGPGQCWVIVAKRRMAVLQPLNGF